MISKNETIGLYKIDGWDCRYASDYCRKNCYYNKTRRQYHHIMPGYFDKLVRFWSRDERAYFDIESRLLKLKPKRFRWFYEI